MSMFTLPINALDQDLVSQTELVLMITEPTQETTQVPYVGHLEPAASPPSTAWQANAGASIQTDKDMLTSTSAPPPHQTSIQNSIKGVGVGRNHLTWCTGKWH